jgi:multidrug efflux system membrane fusion protein
MRVFHSAALLVSAGFVVSACAEPRAAATQAEPPPLVRAAKVEPGRAPPIHAVGSLVGKEEVRLSFKNGGKIDRVLVEAGATVRRGQVLARVNQTEISSQVAQANASAEKAQLDFARVERLHGQGTVPQATYDAAKTALDVASSAAAIARYNEDAAVIVAPDDGVVERRLAEVSEVMAPGQPVFAFRGARRGVVLHVGLTDRDLQSVHAGTRATAKFGALPGESFAGSVTTLASSSTAATGTFEAEIKLDTADPRLLPGLVASVALDRASANVAWIPIEAVVDPVDHQGSVFVLDPGSHVERRAVRIAYLDGARAGISDGLSGSERVVTDGANSCASGGAVRLSP